MTDDEIRQRRNKMFKQAEKMSSADREEYMDNINRKYRTNLHVKEMVETGKWDYDGQDFFCNTEDWEKFRHKMKCYKCGSKENLFFDDIADDIILCNEILCLDCMVIHRGYDREELKAQQEDPTCWMDTKHSGF